MTVGYNIVSKPIGLGPYSWSDKLLSAQCVPITVGEEQFYARRADDSKVMVWRSFDGAKPNAFCALVYVGVLDPNDSYIKPLAGRLEQLLSSRPN